MARRVSLTAPGLGLLATLAGFGPGCSEDPSSVSRPGGGVTGGTTSSGTGGASSGGTSTGGLPSMTIGGTKATGGAAATTGGASATGGSNATGGASGGSKATGGADPMGGEDSGTGGSKATGGAANTGGKMSTGGLPNQGGQGGDPGAGGDPSTGGTAQGGTNTGGSKATGGTAGSGTVTDLAAGKDTSLTMKSEAANPADNAVDGDMETRWCPPDGDTGYEWIVDLGDTYTLTELEISWEFDDTLYGYTVEVSDDASAWTMELNNTGNTEMTQTQTEALSASGRYVRIIVTALPAPTGGGGAAGSGGGGSEVWGCFVDVKIFGS